MRTKHVIALPLVLTGTLWCHVAFAGSYRGASIDWRVPAPDVAPLTVEVSVVEASQADSPICDEVDFGDGTESASCAAATPVGGGLDPAGSPFTVLRYVATHTFAAPASYTLSLGGCCRPDGLAVGSGESFRVTSEVALGASADAGPPNLAGPKTAFVPVLGLPVGGPSSFDLPAFDDDGDPVACRLAEDAEAGFTGAVPALGDGSVPLVSSLQNGCHVTWDLTNATVGDRFVLPIVIASTHAGATSSTAADFIVQMVSGPTPTCAGGGTFVTPIGQTFTSPLVGTDPGGGALTLSAIGADPSELVGALGQLEASPVSSAFAWTPTYADRGTTRLVIASFTNELEETGSCALALRVPTCVGFGAPCTVGVGQCAAFGTMTCQGGEGSCSAVAGTPVPEICADEIDNDCDGVVDNGCGTPDSDGDGLDDLVELAIGTNAFDADSDDDGVPDGAEPLYDQDTDGDGLINALDPDSDGDRILDGTELGLDCLNPATDMSQGHCIPDADAGATKTDPTLADTDGGGMPDGLEDENHDGVVEKGERDPLDPLDDGACANDAACGGPTSGIICDAAARCVPGCRGTGNGCPSGETCSSTTEAAGECVAQQGSGDGGATSVSTTSSGAGGAPADPEAGSGGDMALKAAPPDTVASSCAVGSGSSEHGGAFVVLALSAVGLARRRQRRA